MRPGLDSVTVAMAPSRSTSTVPPAMAIYSILTPVSLISLAYFATSAFM